MSRAPLTLRLRAFLSQRRGQSLLEVGLVTPLLLLLLGLSADGARVFFISNAMTDAAREGALYAIHHGNDSGVTSASLASGIRAVMGGEDQGSLGAFHCPSWPGTPGAPSASDAQVTNSGAVPPPTGTTTSVTITATCRVTPLLGFLPLPNPMVLKTTVESAVVPQT